MSPKRKATSLPSHSQDIQPDILEMSPKKETQFFFQDIPKIFRFLLIDLLRMSPKRKAKYFSKTLSRYQTPLEFDVLRMSSNNTMSQIF